MPKPVIHRFSFSFFRITTVVALALAISGITWNMTPEGLKSPNIVVKVGMILYIVSWVVLCAFLGDLFLRRSSIAEEETRTLAAVAISAPFLLVRIIYAMLLWFLADSTFNALDGNNTAQLVMSVLVEMVVVFVCLAVGLKLRVRGKQLEDCSS
jgi:uncharacterized membrane protein